MVLLSFSVKEAELLAGTKIRTTRLYTPEKWKQWEYTVAPHNPRQLDIWWKSRTKDGYKLFMRDGADLYRLKFRDINGRAWPCKEYPHITGHFLPMSHDEAQQWAREEGFENDLKGLALFFETHYDLTERLI